MSTSTTDTTSVTDAADAMALLAALPLEDGRPWGAVAEPFQRDDAQAILSPEGPSRHYLLRGRGMSKTSDTAGLALALLLTSAPPRSRSYCYAADTDQSAILYDALEGFVERAHLDGLLDVQARLVTNRKTGATLSVESSDGASAYGLRPWLVVADELGVWPSGANHRKLWAAIASGMAKVKGSRLVVIGTGGSPGGLGSEVWQQAVAAPQYWRTAVHPGPSPWWSEDDVEATRHSLTESEWRRLILCQWAEGDDALTTADDVAACVRGGSTAEPYDAAHGPHILTLDVGTRRDLTAVSVSHREAGPAGPVVVIDRVLSWRPGSGQADSDGRVDLAEVEASIRSLASEYHATVLRFDRMQAEQLSQNLARHGLRPVEFLFTAAGANRLARGLANALRDRTVSLPDDPELVSELGTARLVETSPGTVKLQNPAGTHDDLPTVVGMALAHWNERPDQGPASVGVPRGRGRSSALSLAANAEARHGISPQDRAAMRVQLRGAARRSPRGLPGGALLGVPGAYDDPTRPGGAQGGRRR